MPRFHRSATLLATALLSALAAGVATHHWFRHAGATRLRLARKTDHLRELLAMADDMTRWETALKRREQDAPKRIPSLEEVLSRALPGRRPESLREVRTVPLPGWVVRRSEATLGDIAIGDLIRLVRVAGSDPPSWRMAECRIWASPHTPGAVQAALLFEAIERTQ